MIEKITDLEVSAVHVQASPDKLPEDSQQAKKVFDNYPDIIKDKVNEVVDGVNTSVSSDNPEFTKVPTIDGVPFVERGENENGSWEKWWDGTLICRNDTSKTGAFGGTAPPYNSSAVLFTFPIEFMEKPDVLPFAHINDSVNYSVFGSVYNTPTATNVYVLGLSSTKFTNSNVQIGYEAKGRWK